MWTLGWDAASLEFLMSDPSAPDLLLAVRAAIDQMSDAERAALRLVCLEGLSYQAAADRLGVPLTDFKETLLSARQLILARLQDRAS
jgi:DNA-directed RNA polymerase specialized sigma24 family protein